MKAFWERLKAMPTWQKVLLIVAIVAVVGIALYMRSKNAQGQSTPTTASSGLLNGVDTYGNPLYNNGYNGLGGGGGITPVGPPGPPTYNSLTVRQPGAAGTWDTTHTGIPLRDQPGGGGNIIGYIPWGTTVQPTGGIVSGSANQAGGSTNWFPVTWNGLTGFVSQWDISPVGGASPNRTLTA